MPDALLGSGSMTERAECPLVGLGVSRTSQLYNVCFWAWFLSSSCVACICILLVIFSHMSVCVCRWWAGEWEACSATCGPHGEKKRTVLCIQTMGSDEQALQAKDCQHLLKPKTLISCNRDILCPSDWTVGNWSEVSSRVKRETDIIHTSSAPHPFFLINQSKVTLGEITQWPALSPLAWFLHSPPPNILMLDFHSYRIFSQWSNTF